MDQVNKKDINHFCWQTSKNTWEINFNNPVIMGIFNLTPDSFSDGGSLSSSSEIQNVYYNALQNGANIIDVGAESTRPGAKPLSATEEWERLNNFFSSIDINNLVPISVDTYKAQIAEKAILNGAAIINDIYAGRKDPDILKVAADYQVPIILMHMQGDPQNMQKNPTYTNIIKEVKDFFEERIEAALKAGILKEFIWLDPGIGFGKNFEHNLDLIVNFDKIKIQGYRMVMALSRKAFIGKIIQDALPNERDLGTAIFNSYSLLKGADIIRVHNIKFAKETALISQVLKNIIDKEKQLQC